MTPTEIIADLRRQADMKNVVWPCVLLKNLMPLCDAYETQRRALVEVRRLMELEQQFFAADPTREGCEERAIRLDTLTEWIDAALRDGGSHDCV